MRGVSMHQSSSPGACVAHTFSRPISFPPPAPLLPALSHSSPPLPAATQQGRRGATDHGLHPTHAHSTGAADGCCDTLCEDKDVPPNTKVSTPPAKKRKAATRRAT